MFADRLEEEELRPQVCLQPDILEWESCTGGNELDELGLVVERGIVGERGYGSAVPLDHRDRSRRRCRRLVDPPPVLVDPAVVTVESVDDLERGIVQRLRQRVAQRNPCVE